MVELLLLVRSMGPLNLPVKSRCSRLDINMTNPLVFNMPVELGLELMAIVRSDGLNTERKFIYNIIDEVDGILLIMSLIDFKSSNACSIVNRGVLEAFDFCAV